MTPPAFNRLILESEPVELERATTSPFDTPRPSIYSAGDRCRVVEVKPCGALVVDIRKPAYILRAVVPARVVGWLQ